MKEDQSIEGVDVGRLAELLEKATPGPWTHRSTFVFYNVPGGANVCAISEPRSTKSVQYTPVELGSADAEEVWANGDLIALAPTMARALLSLASTLPERVAEAKDAERKRCMAIANQYRDWCDPEAHPREMDAAKWIVAAISTGYVDDCLDRDVNPIADMIAEAVMGEREACAQLCDQSAALSEELGRDADIAINVAALDGERVAAGVLARMIRSRPAPAHPMAGVPHDARTLLAEACLIAGQLIDSDASDENKRHARRFADQARAALRGPSPTPPADDRVQGVVEAIKLARRVVVSVASEGWPDAELYLSGSQVPARAIPRKIIADICRLEGVLDDALSILTPGAPDHG